VDEQHAIRRLKQGDIRGLEWLVMQYQLKALRAAFLITQDRPMAEDIVQEAFIHAFAHIHSFDERRPFAPWFMRSVVNASVKAVQRVAKRTVPFPEGDTPSLEKILSDKGLSPEEQIELSEFQGKVREAMLCLSPRQRAAVVLRYFLDMTEKEMSDEMGIAPGTVKWLLHAARKNLRALLNPKRKQP
jgi:RNA polymerase sigma-70 factor (ECF subfamily)